MFYILCESDADGYHVVGYFSKEKNSPEDFNLACILVFPQCQRKGFGKFLIACSYDISRREDKTGSPEKPLSDLGRLSYRSFWTELLLRVLRDRGRDLQVKDIAAITYMKADDIVNTLQQLSLIKYWKGQHMVSCSAKQLDALLEQHRLVGKYGLMSAFDPSKLVWRPPKAAPATVAKVRR